MFAMESQMLLNDLQIRDTMAMVLVVEDARIQHPSSRSTEGLIQ